MEKNIIQIIGDLKIKNLKSIMKSLFIKPPHKHSKPDPFNVLKKVSKRGLKKDKTIVGKSNFRFAGWNISKPALLIFAGLFGVIGILVFMYSRAAPTVSVASYSYQTIHNSNPIYSAFTGAWVEPNGSSVTTAFSTATGNAGPPYADDWSKLTNMTTYLTSANQGASWTKKEEVVKTPGTNVNPPYAHAYFPQATTRLKDGGLIRRVNAEDFAGKASGVQPTAYIQRQAPGSTTWSAPQYLLDPNEFTYQLSRIQYLKDGRLIATGQSWSAKAGTRNANSVVRALLLVSGDNGVTWQNGLVAGSNINVAQRTAPTSPFANEWDIAEMPNGNLLAVFRSYPLTGGTTQVRNQATLQKNGAVWSMTNIKPMTRTPGGQAVPHSGHPDLLAVKEGENTPNGIILYLATTGHLYTVDGGNNWLPLTGSGMPGSNALYYPTATQTNDGTVYVFAHVSAGHANTPSSGRCAVYGDGCPGAVNYRIDVQKFKLNVSGITTTPTPPDTTINSGPTGTTSATTASFSFSANKPGASFTCKLDNEAYAACTSPKSYSGLSVGSHSFSVRASDSAGTDATPATLTWTVSGSTGGGNNSITITSPAGGSSLSGMVNIAANTTGTPITKVEFYRGGTALLCTDTATPYTCSWDTRTVGDSSYGLTAKMYIGTSVITSSQVTVNVNNGGGTPNPTPTSVSITSPAPNAKLAGTVTINANVTGSTPISKVEFYRGGIRLICTDTAAPFTCSWNTLPLYDAIYGLTAIAYDSSGKSVTSPTVTVSVENGGNLPPTGSTKPADANGDNVINSADLAILASNWGKTGRTKAQGDLNGDGIVNSADLAILASGWGK